MSEHVPIDFVVVGTGAGGLVGAIAAKLNGLNPLIIEKASVWGGTSALSGGGVWIPANPLMEREGVPDSPEEAMAYIDATVGDVGPASSQERRRAYVENGPQMVLDLEKQGFKWLRAPRYPDYYPNKPGAKIGRTLEGLTSDANALGPWLKTLRSSGLPGMVMSTDKAPDIPTSFRSFRSFVSTVGAAHRRETPS